MKTISVDELKSELGIHQNEAGYDFINVCTPEEYTAKHIEGVRNVPLDRLPEFVPEFLDKKHIYVHCQSGGRSQAAINFLETAGIDAELINVEGGLMAWSAAGHETKSNE